MNQQPAPMDLLLAFAQVFNLVETPMVIIDRDIIKQANNAFAALVGMHQRLTEVPGMSLKRLLGFNAWEHLERGLAATLTGQSLSMGLPRDRGPALQCRIQPFSYTGDVRHLVIFTTTPAPEGGDRFEREQLYQTLAESARDMVFVIDREDTVRYVNSYGAAAMGLLPRDMIGRPRSLFFPERPGGTQRQSLNRVMVSGEALAMEGESAMDSRTSALSTWLVPLKDDNGQVYAVMGVSRDISARKEMEQALKRSERDYRSLVETSPDAIVKLDRGCHRMMQNNRLATMLGYDDSARDIPIDFKDILVSEDLPRFLWDFAQTLRHGHEHARPYQLLRRDGRKLSCEAGMSPILDSAGQPEAVLVVIRDITERLAMQKELDTMRNLESLGQLAGGIAHDFNNILTALWGNISLARMLAHDPEKVKDRLHEAEQALLRAKALTGQLLTFAKGGAPVKKAASIRELVAQTLAFALRGSKVDGSVLLSDDLWPAEIDEGQIHQVLHNVVLNAAQAMPGGGTVKVRGCNVPSGLAAGLPLGDGPYVCISVEDAGLGIDADVLPRIFEPYFTTKQDGTGLGLATSYSIIQRHGGLIQADSQPGEGTTVRIYLPAAPDAQPGAAPPEQDIVPGHGRILLMDDETDIREVAGQLLRKMGYQVETAADGRDALERFQRALLSPAPFDAVILDQTIPGGLGGEQTMAAMRELDPEVKGVVASGYATAAVMADFARYGFRASLAKPYRAEELSHVLARVLIRDEGDCGE